MKFPQKILAQAQAAWWRISTLFSDSQEATETARSENIQRVLRRVVDDVAPHLCEKNGILVAFGDDADKLQEHGQLAIIELLQPYANSHCVKLERVFHPELGPCLLWTFVPRTSTY